MAGGAAQAQATDTLRIQATVARTCNVVALPMMFGTVALKNPSADAQASVIVQCTPGVAYTVTMNDGLHALGAQRRMENPVANPVREYLQYEIYRNAARTLRWGGTAATGVSGVAPAGPQVVLTAYGRTAGKRSAAGAYSDLITVTVTF